MLVPHVVGFTGPVVVLVEGNGKELGWYDDEILAPRVVGFTSPVVVFDGGIF